MSTASNVRQIRTPQETPAQNGLQEFWHRHFMPRPEVQMVAQQAKGVFLPYPLLAILVIIGGAVLSFVIALEVQVSNLSTTILLRDADQRAAIHDLQEKLAQHEVYIHDDREKLIRLQTRSETEPVKRR